MRDVFRRLAAYDNLDGVSLSDYEPYQLVAYVKSLYPGDPAGALKILKDNHEIGFLLYNISLLLLEGSQSVERN